MRDLGPVPDRPGRGTLAASGRRYRRVLPGPAGRAARHRRRLAPQAVTPQRRARRGLRPPAVRGPGQRRDRRVEPTADRWPGRPVEGGWFDAGDFIKFTHTTAYADSLLLVAERDLGRDAPAGLEPEIRFGLDWLRKAWDPAPTALHPGRHRLRQPGRHLPRRPRPVAAARGGRRADRRGEPVPAATGRRSRRRAPGRLAPEPAGRLAAAFALAAQVDAAADPGRARAELALAATSSPGPRPPASTEADVVTALPHAFYPESAWRDDLELGATELAQAAAPAARPAGRRLAGGRIALGGGVPATEARRRHPQPVRRQRVGARRADPRDRLSHGHPRLAVTPARLVADLRRQLAIGLDRPPPTRSGPAATTPTSTSRRTPSAWSPPPRSTGADRSHALRRVRQPAAQLGLRRQPLGRLVMIGVGTTFPACPQHVVANLSGSLDRTRRCCAARW